MALSFGCSKDDANELVQEMYIRITKYVDSLDKIMYNESELNTYYIYLTLRNLYLSNFHGNGKKKNIHFNEYELNDLPSELVDYDVEKSFTNLVDNINNIVNEWYWYDRKLWNLHFEKGMSMRKISRETKISLKSIFNTLSNGKEKIRQLTKKEYKTYKDTKES